MAIALGNLSVAALPVVQRQAGDLWESCNVMGFVPEVVERACGSFPDNFIRALDALHLAFYENARRASADLVMLSLDQRLRFAVLTAGGTVLPER